MTAQPVDRPDDRHRLIENYFKLKIISAMSAGRNLMKTAIIGGGPAGLYFAILHEEAAAGMPTSRSTSATAPTTRSASASCFPTRPSTISRNTICRAIGASPANSPIGTTSRSTSRAPMHRIGGNGFCGCSRRTLLLILQERARGARRRAALSRPTCDDESLFADADLVVVADGINSRFRERYADAFRARGGSAAEQVRLDGLDQAARCLHLHLPGDRVGAVHRPCLPVRGEPLDLGVRDRSGDLRAGRARRTERGRIGRAHGSDLRLVPRRPPRSHQPLDLAQLPDDPQQALGHGQQGAARRRQGDGAFLHRLGHQARDGGCHRALRGLPPRAERRRRARRSTRPAGARRSRRRSTPPTCRWSGSSTWRASGISIRCSSPSA